MKIYIALFVALIAAGCGVMLMDGYARTVCTYALVGVAGVSAVVLATGLAD
jgi:hypothetical protein